MTNELEIIKIEGSDVELTVGGVAEDLGLLAQIENEQQDLAAKADERAHAKLDEHIDYLKRVLDEFIDTLDPAQQLHWEELEKMSAQHKKNTHASISGIQAGVAPEQERSDLSLLRLLH